MRIDCFSTLTLAIRATKALVLGILLLSTSVNAHDINFGYLNIAEAGDGEYEFLFRFTSKQLDLKKVEPRVPKTCTIHGYEKNGFRDVERTFRWKAQCDTGSIFKALPWVEIRGLPENQHLIVRLKLDGKPEVEQLSQSNPIYLEAFEKGDTSAAQLVPASGFLFIGFGHIIEGYDHLLVVLCFLLLFQRTRELLFVVTGFTVGHSMSLILVSLFSVGLPASVVEILITLSVAFMARECFLGSANTAESKDTIMQTYPVVMSSLIGLLHGLGFAAALQDLGLPPDNNVGALLMFNVGIELGQLLFVAIGLLGLFLVSRFIGYREQWVKLMSIGIGASSFVWLLQLS